MDSTARILLVEDDDALRQVLAEVLADEGYAVKAAPDGATALALVESGVHPDLVLLDLLMPGMGGEEVIDRLRGSKASDVPIVVLSALPDWQPPQGVKALRKPAELEDVLDVVRAHVH